MTATKRRLLLGVVGGLLLLPVLTGCQSGAPDLSKQEKQNFNGGPMPPQAREIFQQKMREAQQKARTQNPGPGGGPPAANPAGGPR
jgi:hypothetical protein